MKSTLLSLTLILAVCACQPSGTTSSTKSSPQMPNAQISFPSLSSAMTCLSDSGPILALHRGRDKGKDQAENALQTLEIAYDNGFIMAEIDVAQTKDGTLFLFHDGVWDEKTTGKGVVAASTTSYLDKLILKTPRGKLTAYRPSHLSDVLSWAKGKIYLEIDFKSSANERDVIDMIKTKGLGDQVVLISYTDKQAKRLAKMAPNMMISTSNPNALRAARKLAWLGTDNISDREIGYIKSSDIFTTFGQFSARRPLPENWRDIDILVTDYPSELRRKIGQNQTDRERLEGCK